LTDHSPLTDVRVLDLSRLFPGPYCSRILADFGAEVVKVEPPDGSDWLRHAPPLEDGVGILFRALNQGKKNLTLNLKSQEGRDVFLRLAETADVVLEGFRPGVMERLGLSYRTLSVANPRLIYCALTGYGQDGPYKVRAGHDLNYIGLAGLLDLTGPCGGPPSIPGAQVADVASALWAAVGILLALLARQRTGRGQRVDSSLLGAALAFLPKEVAQGAGAPTAERGSGELTGGRVCYNVYEARDGGYVTLAALEPKFWADFCQAAGREDLLGCQFAAALPGEWAYEELCALFRTRTRQEWTEALAGIDACCEPVYTLGEALSSAPVQALEMSAGLRFPLPLRFSATERYPPGPVSSLGQHTAALLAELGYDETAVATLRKKGVV
jgi:alpha-methylacyl-CoA racemase